MGEVVAQTVAVAQGDWLREQLGLGDREPVGDRVVDELGEPERDTVIVPVMVGVNE